MAYILAIQRGGKLMNEWIHYQNIRDGNIKVTEDEFGGRIYHSLLAGEEARRYIKINNESLIEVDVKGSQTLLYHSLLLAHNFIEDRWYGLGLEYELSPAQKDRVHRIIKDEDIYTLMVTEHNKVYPNRKLISRKSAKSMFQKALSGVGHFERSLLSRVYGFEPPLFIGNIKRLGLEPKQVTPFILQSLEAEIIFKAWADFNNIYPNIPCIPRHDSLSVPSLYVDLVKEALRKAYLSRTTLNPRFEVSTWHANKAALDELNLIRID